MTRWHIFPHEKTDTANITHNDMQNRF